MIARAKAFPHRSDHFHVSACWASSLFNLPQRGSEVQDTPSGFADTSSGIPDTHQRTGSSVMPVINYREEIDRIAGPSTLGETRESRLALAARRLGLSFRTVRRLYYREITDPKASIHLKFEALCDGGSLALAGVLSRLTMLEQGHSSQGGRA